MDKHEPCADLTSRIIGLAIKVYRKLGPGLLESIYQECLCWEFAHDGLTFQRQVPLAVFYEDLHLTNGKGPSGINRAI